MSVSAAATRPPVQDSAVAIVSLRDRQRSSSVRAIARASLPGIWSRLPAFRGPRQTNGGAGGGCDAFLAAGEAEPLAGGRLDRDTRHIHTGDLGDPRPHLVAQGTNFGPLADHRHFQIG